jgi:hypothetical protein
MIWFNRRRADIPSTFVPLNVGAGMLINDAKEEKVTVMPVTTNIVPVVRTRESDGKFFSFLKPK